MVETINIKANKIQQLVNKEIFISTMNILQLKDIIKYTNRKSNENFIHQSEKDLPKEEYLYYQRIKSSDRAYQIKLFFLRHIWNMYFYEKRRISPLGTFPSSIILAFNTFDSQVMQEYNSYLQIDKKPESIFINEDENLILIPKSNQGLIVDGQHRIAGLELLLEEVQNGDIIFRKANKKDYYTDISSIPKTYIIDKILSFSFIISILSDFDLYEQSEIFATVNFNQQKVNKSFYYDIFGTASTGKTIEKLLHDITSHLNYKEDSPLFHKIKMLGSGPGYFSQAFIVDALIPHFKNGTFQFVYSDFQKDGSIYKKIPDFLKAYFKVIFDLFKKYLPKKDEKLYRNNLLKTTGMGAFILLLPIVFNYVKNVKRLADPKDVLDLTNEELTTLFKRIFKEIQTKGEVFFGEDGRFSKGSGKGLQNALFDEINKYLGIKIKPEESEEPLI